MDKETKSLAIKWFSNIEEMAKTRKTGNGFAMDDDRCLDEIAAYAKSAREYIENF